MDPITTIGLAGNIVQFVDFSWGLLCESKRLYDSGTGASAENDVLDTIADDVIRLSDALTAPSAIGAVPDQMRDLARQCKGVAYELLTILDHVKAKGPRKKWTSFVAALRSVWKKEEIEGLVTRMEKLRNQMQTHLQWMLW